MPPQPDIDLYDAATALFDALKYWIGTLAILAGISVIPYLRYRKAKQLASQNEQKMLEEKSEKEVAKQKAKDAEEAAHYAEYVDNVVTRAINEATAKLWDDLMREDSGKSLHDLSKKLSKNSEDLTELRSESKSFSRSMEGRIGRIEKQVDMLLPVTMDVSKKLHNGNRWTDPAIVMMVDDDASFIALATFLLSESDIVAKVFSADKVSDASLKRADVILLDLGLAETDGMDTLMAMMALTPHTPIVVMTSDNTIGGEAIRAGAAQYLPKDVLTRNRGDARQTLEQVVSLARRNGQRRFIDQEGNVLESGDQRRRGTDRPEELLPEEE